MLLASQYPDLIDKLVLAEPSPIQSLLVGQPKANIYFGKRKRVLQAAMKSFFANRLEEGLKQFVGYVAGKNA